MKNTQKLFPVKCAGKVGFSDEDGKIVVDCIYDEARYFNKDGRAKVKLNGEVFYIDTKGNRVE